MWTPNSDASTNDLINDIAANVASKVSQATVRPRDENEDDPESPPKKKINSEDTAADVNVSAADVTATAVDLKTTAVGIKVESKDDDVPSEEKEDAAVGDGLRRTETALSSVSEVGTELRPKEGDAFKRPITDFSQSQSSSHPNFGLKESISSHEKSEKPIDIFSHKTVSDEFINYEQNLHPAYFLQFMVRRR